MYSSNSCSGKHKHQQRHQHQHSQRLANAFFQSATKPIRDPQEHSTISSVATWTRNGFHILLAMSDDCWCQCLFDFLCEVARNSNSTSILLRLQMLRMSGSWSALPYYHAAASITESLMWRR